MAQKSILAKALRKKEKLGYIALPMNMKTKNRQVKTALTRMAGIYLPVLLFLLPLKFGTLVNVGEIGVFPLHWLEWLLTSWPPFLLAPLAGIALLLALVAFPSPKFSDGGGRAWLIWLLLALASLLGLWQTASWDFALRFLWHLIGVLALSLAAWRTVAAQPAWRNRLFLAIALGGLAAALHGWQQVPGGGLRETLEFAERMAQESGHELSADMRSRLQRGRAFGPFVYPNSYAAHLLLAGPLTLLFCAKGGQAAGRWLSHDPTVEKLCRNPDKLPTLGQAAVFAVGLALWLGALWFSGSRAALIALFGALAISSLSLLRRRRSTIILTGLALLVGTAVFAYRQQGRIPIFQDARLDYWQAAATMIQEQPLTGVGLGEFFHHYTRLKGAEMEVARTPHNGFLFFAAQAGLIAGLVFLAIGCLALRPLLALRQARRHVPAAFAQAHSRNLLLLAGGAGTLAWFLHALADFNILIPGTVATMAVLTVIAPASRNSAEQAETNHPAHDPTMPTDQPGHGWQKKILAVALAALALAGIWRWPGDRAYMELTAARVELRSLPQFAEAVERAARLSPFSPHPWQLLGHQAEALQAPTIAAEAFRQTTKLTPHWAAMWFGVARNELAAGNREAAREALRQGLEWYPQAPEPEIAELRRQLLP